MWCHGGVTELGETRDGFRFRSGSLALDFAATLAARLKERPRELLGTVRGSRPLVRRRWLGIGDRHAR